MTEEMQRKEIEREIRLALLAFLANKDTPLEHIWQEIVQPHLRENPPAINRGESYVMNVPINELITWFKIACKMLGSQDKREKTYPPRISSSNTKPTKEITTNNQRKRCDKCITLNTPCSPSLPLCKESRHQKDRASRTPTLNHLYKVQLHSLYEPVTKEHSQNPT